MPTTETFTLTSAVAAEAAGEFPHVIRRDAPKALEKSQAQSDKPRIVPWLGYKIDHAVRAAALAAGADISIGQQVQAEIEFRMKRERPLFIHIEQLQDLVQKLLLELNAAVYRAIEYVPKSTRVDSPTDDALRNRQGVCQDYAHIVIALVRHLGIPCRYVSGYLFHREGVKTRSAEGATHAWVEAYLPDIGWTGFDPTNNTIAGETHVRTAVGRDYADVPPTRGVFKGNAESELTVAVRVAPSDKAPPPEAEMAPEDWSEVILTETGEDADGAVTAQQQQQQ